MTAVYKRELKAYMSHPRGFMFIPLLLLVLGILVFKYNIMDGVANISYAFYANDWASYALVVLIPLLCMGSVASDRKNQIDRFYFSLPLKTSSIVLGKYLALLTVFAIPMGIVCLYPVVLSFLGKVNFAWAYATLGNYFLMGAFLIALCMFISSLTKYMAVSGGVGVLAAGAFYLLPVLSNHVPAHPVASLAGFSVVALLLMVVAWFVTKHVPTLIVTSAVSVLLLDVTFAVHVFVLKGSAFVNVFPSTMSYVSPFYHFSIAAVDGVMDLFGVGVMLSLTVLFVFMTVRSLDQRRYA